MGQATKAICELVGSVVLHSWSATARLISVLLVLAVAAWAAAAFVPWQHWL
jgi:hypothetical protein